MLDKNVFVIGDINERGLICNHKGLTTIYLKTELQKVAKELDLKIIDLRDKIKSIEKDYDLKNIERVG